MPGVLQSKFYPYKETTIQFIWRWIVQGLLFTSQISEEPFQEDFPTFWLAEKITNQTVEGVQSSNINSTNATKNIANNHQLEITWVYKNLPHQNENHAGTISQQKSIRDRERKSGTLSKVQFAPARWNPVLVMNGVTGPLKMTLNMGN